MAKKGQNKSAQGKSGGSASQSGKNSGGSSKQGGARKSKYRPGCGAPQGASRRSGNKGIGPDGTGVVSARWRSRNARSSCTAGARSKRSCQ